MCTIKVDLESSNLSASIVQILRQLPTFDNDTWLVPRSQVRLLQIPSNLRESEIMTEKLKLNTQDYHSLKDFSSVNFQS